MPLGFPVRVRAPEDFVAKLARLRIFAPRHWRELVAESPPERERALQATLVTLPCDQRYNLEDMSWVAEAARRALE